MGNSQSRRSDANNGNTLSQLTTLHCVRKLCCCGYPNWNYNGFQNRSSSQAFIALKSEDTPTPLNNEDLPLADITSGKEPRKRTLRSTSSHDEGAATRLHNLISDDETNSHYQRRGGVADGQGLRYEHKISSLLYARSINRNNEFRLATNTVELGSFDDIFYTYQYNNSNITVMIQLKHKSHDRFVIIQQHLETNKSRRKVESFSLLKYFSSYSTITKQCSNLDNMYFILYTTAILNDSLISPQKLPDVCKDMESLFHTGGRFNFLDKDVILNICKCSDEEASDFQKHFLIYNGGVKENHIQVLINQEVIKYFKRLHPNSHYVSNHLIVQLQNYCELKGIVHYINKNTESLKYNDENSFISKVKFCDEEIKTLGKQLVESSECIIYVTFNGAGTELRSMKIMQALSLVTKKIVLFGKVSELVQNEPTVIDIWETEQSSLLAIDTEDNTKQDPEMNSRLSQILRKNKDAKLIIISGGENCHLFDTLKSEPDLTWKMIKTNCGMQHFDKKFQQLLLSTTINFQGKNITLDSLNQKHVIQEDLKERILSKFLTANYIHQVGVLPPTNGDQYVEQKLMIKVNINTEKLRKVDGNINVASTTRENLQKYTCDGKGNQCLIQEIHSDVDSKGQNCTHSENSKCNAIQKKRVHRSGTQFVKTCSDDIHILENKDGSFIWKETHGSTDCLCNCIQVDEWKTDYNRRWMSTFKTSSPSVKSILEQDIRTVIVTGKPGMGKTKLMTQVTKIAKELFPYYWIVRINLNDVTSDLEQMMSTDITEADVTKLLQDAVGIEESTCPELAQLLLKDSIWRTGNIIVLIDGFDEISPHYTDSVLKILSMLQMSETSKLWVTSRPVMREQLERRLSSETVSLQPITNEQQKELLISIWSKKGTPEHLESFTENLLKSINKRNHSDVRSLTSTPLYLIMVSELYIDCAMEGKFDVLSSNLSMFHLYSKIMDKIYERYCQEKLKKVMTLSGVKIEIQRLKYDMIQIHMVCAVETILNPDEIRNLNILNLKQNVASVVDNIERGEENVGIIHYVKNGQPKFTHRTFAEYLTGYCFSQHKSNNYICALLLKPRLNVVKYMFDNILARDSSLHLAVLNCTLNYNFISSCRDNIDYRDEGGRTALHLAAQGTNAISYKMVKLLLDSKANVDITDNIYQHTPLYYAVDVKSWDIVKLLVSHGAKVNHNIAKERLVKDMIDKIEDSTDGTYKMCPKFEINWCVFRHRSEMNVVETIFHKAIRNSHLECVNLFLNTGADINLCDSNGNTLLYVAAETENMEVVRLLLEKGADVTLSNRDGTTPLITAVRKENMEIVDMLISKGADVNECNKNGETPIHIAAQGGHTELLELLIKKNCDINVRTKSGDTPLHMSARKCKVEPVVLLLKNCADINASNNSMNTPLLLAARNGGTEIVKLLLDRGASTNHCNKDGNTPLHEAANCSNAETIKLLLNDVMISATNVNGDTPLHIVARWGSLEQIVLLLEKSTNIESQNRYGCTPLHLAACKGDTDMVRLLLERGIDIKTRCTDDDTVLHLAAEMRETQLIKLLLEEDKHESFLISAVNKMGNTPLHVSADKGNVESIKLLLSKGADITSRNQRGDTPLHKAAQNGEVNAMDILIQKGADISASNEEGDTPLHLVARGGETDIALRLAGDARSTFQRAFDLLVEKGGNKEALNSRGETPVYIQSKKSTKIIAPSSRISVIKL